LDVRFDPAGPQAVSEISFGAPVKEIVMPDVPPVPAELTDVEKQVLTAIQTELPVSKMPFEDIPNMPAAVDFVEILQSLSGKRVLGKIAAVLNYRRLGYTANAMFCAEVSAERIGAVGAELAACPMVSHCYERKTFDGWPFNLYGMCHAASLEQIAEVIDSFCIANDITHTQLLPTERELKKQPVRITFSELRSEKKRKAIVFSKGTAYFFKKYLKFLQKSENFPILLFFLDYWAVFFGPLTIFTAKGICEHFVDFIKCLF
jgi:DNA-binding Lrp family transcriptional regulator